MHRIRTWLRRVLDVDETTRCLHHLIRHVHNLEEIMAKATEQLAELSTKVDDLISDVRAALAVINDDQLSPQAQEALDGLTAKIAAFDAEVGDADGSETPVEPAPAEGDETTRL